MESIVKDISQYFEFLQESGQARFNLSDESKDVINEWGIVCEGNAESIVYIIDSKSVLFGGESGKLLLKILGAMNLTKESVCICGISCPDAVRYRLTRVKPEVIITFGQDALKLVIDNRAPLTHLRGKFQRFKGIKVMPTWHPLSLLEDSTKKRDVWEDMKIVMQYLGL